MKYNKCILTTLCKYIFCYTYGCFTSMYTVRRLVPVAGGQKRTLDSLKLELQVIVRHLIGATRVLCKSGQCSELLRLSLAALTLL